MKTKQWMGILFAFFAIVSGCTNNNRGVVEHPAFIARNTDALEINKVELNDTATVLYMHAYEPPKGQMQIDSLSFLTDDQGKKYTIRTIDGITLGRQYIMSDSGNVAFKMIFPPVASNAVSIDFSEGNYNGAWNIWGIQLTNRPLKVDLPKDFKEVVVDKNAVLPPVEYKAGKAHLQGQILNFRAGMSDKMFVYVASPFASNAFPLSIDSIGKFSGEIDAFSVHPVTIYWMNNKALCFIAPGDTTSLIINPSGKNGGNNSPTGEPVYYSGFLASLSTEFLHINDSLYEKQQFDSYELYISYLKFIGEKTPEALRNALLDEYKTKKAALDTLNVSPACKQLLLCYLDLSYAFDMTDITSGVDRAYIYNHQLQDDKEAIAKYYATRKLDLPDDFYDALNGFSLLNDPHILFVQGTTEYLSQWHTQNMQPVLSKALGTDQGPLFDRLKLIGTYNDIQNFKPASDTQIEQLPAVYQDFIKNKNNELLQLIESYKKKTAFTEKDITKVANEDVFSFILTKFRGKPVVLDFWATWCGPCLAANEDLKSVKAELAKKGLVFVYVAGENSPLEDWKKMTPDLHGEHFRLTAKQWDYVRKTFGIEGVPTYFFIDRKGDIREKQTGYATSILHSMTEKMLSLIK